MSWELAIVALSVLAVAAVSSRLEGTPVTPAMVFTGLGIVLAPQLANGIEGSSSDRLVKILAEATLALVLFCDAARVKLTTLARGYPVPLRLLGVGLPLTILCGALAAALVLPGLSTGEALVLGVVLAPTDAALGQAIVADPRLPSRIRQGLNVESGLNDGICVPLLVVFLATADVESTRLSGSAALTVIAKAIGWGVGTGAATGLLVSLLVRHTERRRLIAPTWLPVIPLAAAALAYGSATPLDGSGFIAAFVAGTIFGALTGPVADRADRLAEEVGELLGGITFLVFGALLLVPAVIDLTWQIALYAILSLTLVRMAPVAVAMLGSRARAPTVGLLGWFGPRGLASIVFAVITVSEAHLPGAQSILHAAYATIGLSVFAHGASAAPLARRYANWYDAHPSGRAPRMESIPVAAHRLRGRP